MRESIRKRIEEVHRGEVPKGYRRTKDIGIAPMDWKVGQLSDILHNEQRPVPKPNNPYWRLGIRSWAKGTFHTYVDDPASVDMDELYKVKENDLVVNITFAWEHAIAVASKEDNGLLVSHRFPTYMFDDGNVPGYYKAVFSQPCFKDMLDHISPGGAGRNRVLNRKDFLSLPCYIPPISEQQKIAEILATCDRVIELKQQLLEEKRRQKQWLMQKLLDPNSGVRLPGFEESRWTRCRIGDVADIYSGGTPDTKTESFWDGDVLWCTPSDITCAGKYIDRTETTISELGLQKSSAVLMPVGSVLMCSRATIGPRSIAKVPIATNQGFKNFVCKETLYNEFLYYALETVLPDLLKKAAGNTFKEVSKSDLSNSMIDIPRLDEQKAIANRLIMADRDIELSGQELEAWQQKKKALMQLLLTGLVRVNA